MALRIRDAYYVMLTAEELAIMNVAEGSITELVTAHVATMV